MATIPLNQVELEFADGTYLFRINLPQINEYERLCGSGIGEIFARVIAGRYILPSGGETTGFPGEARYKAGDLNEAIRLGLVGGGRGVVNGETVEVSDVRARQLVETYVAPLPYARRWDLAAAVLTACIEGFVPDQPVKGSKKKGAETGPSTTPEPSPISP